MEVHSAGGGINFTVEHTRSASEKELETLLLPRLERMIKAGECRAGNYYTKTLQCSKYKRVRGRWLLLFLQNRGQCSSIAFVSPSSGTTLAECKSGYGLDTQTEIKMLRVLEAAKKRSAVEISSTFCGAHSVPK